MDPNTTLASIRELIKAAETDEVVFVEAASYMFELIRCLDEWLSKGGFLPLDWVATRYADYKA
jgi:hypothetical protein